MKKKNIEDIYPLSPSQQGLLFQTLYKPKSGLHIEQVTCTLQGDLNLSAFQEAWQRVINRHPVLRTGFSWKDLEEPLQVVLYRVKLPLEVQDWQEFSPSRHQEKLRAYLTGDCQRGFDLSKPPLIRLALFKIARDTYQFIITNHHIIMDGWCGPILIKEFLTLYRMFNTGQEYHLPGNRPYRDYIKWLNQQDLSRAETFWKKTIRGFTSPTPLGVEVGPGYSSGQEEGYNEQKASLSAETTAELKTLAQQHQLTLYTLIQGAWALLLSRYSSEDDVVFGTTVSGRPPDLTGAESMIGLFINTLPVRIMVSAERLLWSWLKDIHVYNHEMRPYEYSSGGQIHQWSQVPGSLPLYESLLVFENYPIDLSILQLSDLTVDLRNARSEGARTQFPLTLLIIVGSELSFQLVCDSRRFNISDSSRVLEHFLGLLQDICAQPGQNLVWFKERIPADRIPSFRPPQKRSRQEMRSEFVAPRTPTEARLAQIWAELFDVEHVGIYDDFFAMGGHSMLALQLISRIREVYPMELPLSSLFEGPNVAGLARVIDALRRGETLETVDIISNIAVSDLNAQCLLDPSIVPETKATEVEHVNDPNTIFLTGATGFLGTYLLHQLLQQTRAEIYCLVRASDSGNGKKRIQGKLESYSLWDEVQNSRIIPVQGDLSQAHLGLSAQQFQTLANKVDVIYHNGAWVNYILPYSTLKAVNVSGTREVLRLASQDKVKPLHYISTLGVFGFVEDAGDHIVHEDDDLDHGKVLYGGYAQSKWVAEKLVTIARSRGLPVCIYRPGMIVGDSQTGNCNTNDFIWKFIKGCIQLGKIPEVDTMVEMTPVDFVSQAIVYLSKQKESAGKVFHLCNPHPVHWRELVNWICTTGCALQQVSYEQWQAKLSNHLNHSPDKSLYPLWSLFSEAIPGGQSSAEPGLSQLKIPRYDLRNTIKGLEGSSIVCPPLDDRLFGVYISYLIQSGFLAVPQQNSEPGEK